MPHKLESIDLKNLNDVVEDISNSRTRLLNEECNTNGSVSASDSVVVKKPMKLIAEFAIKRPTSQIVSKSLLQKSVEYLKSKVKYIKNDDKSDVEVINLKVPVENLNKNMFIQVECKHTTINIELHPPIKEHFKKLNRGVENLQAVAQNAEAKEKQEVGNRRKSSVLRKVFSKLARKSPSENSFKWFRSEQPLCNSESVTCYSSGFLNKSAMFPVSSTVSLGSGSSREAGSYGERLKLCATL